MVSFFFNKLFFTFFISLVFHILIISFFFKKQKILEINKYKVMNLASFKEYEPQSLKDENKKTEKIEIEKKKEIQDTQKKEIAKEPEKEKYVNIEKSKEKKKNELKEREIIEIKKDLNVSEKQIVKPKKENNLNTNKLISRNTISKNDKKIQNKELEKYFLLIVEEMTFLAKKSYPRRSRMLEEEGKILIEVVINSNGLIMNTKLKTKKPKRLANAAENLLIKKKKFPNPPQYLFKNTNLFSFEIPINFILK